MQHQEKSLKYIAGFDGLRALAVLSVMLFHWKLPVFQLPFGWVGVQVFFVLSGYLITNILLHDKHLPVKLYLSKFYFRRSLRIFPLYFAYLFIASILLWFLKDSAFLPNAWNEVLQNGFYLLTYTYNFQEFIHGLRGAPYYATAIFSHLWSLSVEEQFYIFFPILIYYTPKKYLGWLVATMIILPPFLRIISLPFLLNINTMEWAGFIQYRLFPFHIDALATGAALAIFNLSRIKNPLKLFYCMVGIIIISGIIFFLSLPEYSITKETLFSLGLNSPVYFVTDYRYIYTFTMLNASAFFLLLHIIRDGKAPLLQFPFLQYFGKISYGIYIFHAALALPFYYVFYKLRTASSAMNITVEFALLLLYFAFVIYISHLSYKYFEKYFLKLKNRKKTNVEELITATV